MRILVQNGWRSKAIFGVIVFILGSIFVSRAMLSISTIIFIGLTVVHPQLIDQVRAFLRSKFLVSISLLFFIPFLSGLWSKNLTEWSEVLVVKLPFLLLPVAFAGSWKLSQRYRQLIAVCFIAFTVLACCWSLYYYFMSPELINESYLRAKTIPTLLADDHVRFSWIVFLAIVTAVFLWQTGQVRSKLLLVLSIVFLAAFLHLLSARTGLVMFYLFSFSYAAYRFVKKPGVSASIIAGLLILLALGWFCFPTFSNRIRYNLYDLSLVWKNEYRSGTSDGNRVASFRAGWALLNQSPVTGAGAGDVWHELDRWYQANVPGMQKTDMLYPSNEWLIYGAIAGWPGVILFTGIAFLPLFIGNIRHRFFFLLFHLSAISLFLVETSLEIQHGIIIYSFFSLWWWKWHRFEAE